MKYKGIVYTPNEYITEEEKRQIEEMGFYFDVTEEVEE